MVDDSELEMGDGPEKEVVNGPEEDVAVVDGKELDMVVEVYCLEEVINGLD